MRRRLLPVLGVMALLGLACGGDDQFREGEGSKITETADIGLEATAPASVKGNVVSLDIEVTGIEVIAADGDTSGRTGHFHVFVDKPPVAPGTEIPRGPGIVHTTDDPIVVPGLAVGDHTFTVVLGDGAHMRIGDYSAEVEVKVAGPSVDASAPGSIVANQPFPVDVAVEGVELVKADGDTSGRTGHLHLFVDKEPAKPGEAIPVGRRPAARTRRRRRRAPRPASRRRGNPPASAAVRKAIWRTPPSTRRSRASSPSACSRDSSGSSAAATEMANSATGSM